MKDLLLIVDVQNGFVSEKTSHIVPKLRKLLNEKVFTHVIFSQFVNKTDSPYENYLNWYRFKTAEEIAIVNELLPFVNQILVKNIYSACNQWLLNYIKENSIQNVYIAGIDTDCCVLITATDLFQNGIRPFVLKQYCASNGGFSSHDAALIVLERLIGDKQILDRIF